MSCPRLRVLCGLALLSSCVSTSALPDLTGQSLDEVRVHHRGLVDERSVHRVLRNGVEQFFFVGVARAEDDDSRALVDQEASLDARDALLEHLVPADKRAERALDLRGVDCPYSWTTGDRRWRGCFVAVTAVAIRERAGAAPAAVNRAAEPAAPTTVSPAPGAPSPVGASPGVVTAPSSSSSTPVPDDASNLLARARALASEGRCREAVAVYDQLLEQHASFSVAAGVVREKFETQKGCP